MDENLSPESDQRKTLRHEKTIAPFDTGLRPEDATPKITVQPQSAVPKTPPSSPAAIPPAPPSPALATSSQTTAGAQQLPDETQFKPGLYWAGKTLKLLFAAVIGAIVSASYFYYLDGSTDIINRGFIAFRSYSPLILIDTIITSIVLMVVYGLILRFILRSQRAVGQTLTAVLTSQLLVIVLLEIEHFNNQSVNIFGGVRVVPLVIAAVIGAAVFAAVNYAAERVWTWRISRVALAASVLIGITAVSFGLSTVISHRHAVKETQKQAASDQAGIQIKAGIYDFKADYKEYYPSDAIQDRFTVVTIMGNSTVKTEDDSDINSLYLSLKDKNYQGTNDALTINISESKPPSSYKPPSNCGDPNPRQEAAQMNSGLGKSCAKIADIPGIGTLYARDEYPGSFNGEKVPGSYDWYYIEYGGTLVTVDTNSTLSNDDVIAVIKSLQPISADSLLQKSKALAASQN